MSENYLSREKIYLIPLLILAASYVFGFRIIAIVMFNTINIRTVDSIDVRLPLFTLGGMPIILAFLLVFISAVIFPFDSKQIIDIKIFGRLFLLGIAFYLFGIPLIMNIIFRLWVYLGTISTLQFHFCFGSYNFDRAGDLVKAQDQIKNIFASMNLYSS